MFLARADAFPDALPAGPMAWQASSPILLTHQGELPPLVANEIRRLDPRAVVLLGGPAAVSSQVAAQVAELGPDVSRISGLTRYDTARTIADITNGNEAAVVSGENFPDAPSAMSLAPNDVLLAQRDRLSFNPAAIGRMTLTGATAVIADGLVNAQRLSGPRYATNLAVLREVVVRRSSGGGSLEELDLLITTGENFPDALTAGVLRQPILLVHPSWSTLPVEVEAFLELNRDHFARAFIFGGEAAVPLAVDQAVTRALNLESIGL